MPSWVGARVRQIVASSGRVGACLAASDDEVAGCTSGVRDCLHVHE